jgi:hypothetical protein
MAWVALSLSSTHSTYSLAVDRSVLHSIGQLAASFNHFKAGVNKLNAKVGKLVAPKRHKSIGLDGFGWMTLAGWHLVLALCHRASWVFCLTVLWDRSCWQGNHSNR